MKHVAGGPAETGAGPPAHTSEVRHMLAEEIIAALLVGFLLGGFFLFKNSLKNPRRTRDDLSAAVEAHEKAALEHERELSVLKGISKEMVGALMLSSGRIPLTAGEEHELHVNAELERKRGQVIG